MWGRMLHSKMMRLVTREKAQLVKCMSGTYEKLSLAPQSPHEILGLLIRVR